MDAQYTVLARRFRPQVFTEVVGQERIAQTLRNAIRENRVAHAYLFTGARGVGKTSMARIFAKALNCPNAKDDVPCNTCEICRGISTGQDVDVSEIDGASNRGIDDIRQLRANIGVKSMRSKYKIYIIDEVHMLTKEAFNALLKTLEEPPPLVKFIFCTTEPNKVPDTILSRCQRFDFGTISVDNISMRLGQLAEAEGFKVEPSALELVARRAAGSMRDSQSIFDQLLAFGSQKITTGDVHRLLGTAPDERIVAIIDALIQRDRAAALQRLEEALNQGVQLEALTDQLVGYLRDLMVLACGASNATLLSVGNDQRPHLQTQATRWGLQTIVAGMQILAEAKARMQRVTFGRALAELALVRISMLEDLDRLEDLLVRMREGGALQSVSSNQSEAPPAAEKSAPQKKNDLTSPAEAVPQPLVEERPEIQDSAPEQPVQIVPAVEPLIQWNSGCARELHAAVMERLTDMIGTYLRRVSEAAISGPSQLDFLFPANYDLDRKACDRPEVISRLEDVIASIVGRRIRVRIRTSEATASEPPKPTKVAVKSQTVDSPEDEYLQAIMNLFGIKIWKVQPQSPETERESGE